MNDREFLMELAFIYENAEVHSVEDSRGTRYIKIEEQSAREAAERLRRIAEKMPSMVH